MKREPGGRWRGREENLSDSGGNASFPAHTVPQQPSFTSWEMTEIRKYYFGLRASVLAYQKLRVIQANYWKLHIELSHWQGSQSNRNVKVLFLHRASCMGVSLQTYSWLQQVGVQLCARKTSPDQYYFLLLSCLWNTFFFGTACLALLQVCCRFKSYRGKIWHYLHQFTSCFLPRILTST